MTNDILEVFHYEPGGTSSKNLAHWIQMYKSKKHNYFDYGAKKNKEIYGRETPPEYDLTKFKNFNISSFITESDNDSLIYPEDTQMFLDLIDKENLKKIVIKVRY
jgi:hypothetical protein